MEVSSSWFHYVCTCVGMQIYKHTGPQHFSVSFFSTSSDIGNVKQVLIRLIGADENMQFSYMDTMQCVEDTDVLEMIVDKFSSSVCDICWIPMYN